MPLLAFLWFRDGRLKIPPIPYILPGAADSRPIFPDPPVRPVPGGDFFRGVKAAGRRRMQEKGAQTGMFSSEIYKGKGSFYRFLIDLYARHCYNAGYAVTDMVTEDLREKKSDAVRSPSFALYRHFAARHRRAADFVFAVPLACRKGGRWYDLLAAKNFKCLLKG